MRRYLPHPESPDSVASGFTILELLTVMGIATVLMSLLLPALGSARESARRVQCTSQLKQIGLALHVYHDGHQCLPVGWQWEPRGDSAYSWAVAILPYLDQQPLYERTNRQETLRHPANQPALERSLPIYLCPSDLTQPRFEVYASGESAPLLELPTASYVGVFGTSEPDEGIPAPPGEGAFLESRPVGLAELRRGLSQTTLVGERTMEWFPVTWLGVEARAADAACHLAGNMLTTPNCRDCDECELGSRHTGGANFLYGDGAVKLVSENINPLLYQELSRRE